MQEVICDSIMVYGAPSLSLSLEDSSPSLSPRGSSPSPSPFHPSLSPSKCGLELCLVTHLTLNSNPNFGT